MTAMLQQYTLEIVYLIASVTFIIGLKMLSQPNSARRGNIIAAIGMTMAVIGTILFHRQDGEPIGNLPWIFAGIALGSVVGTIMARKVKMTGMPQMVSFFNGMGGACAALISMVEFDHYLALHGGTTLMTGSVFTMLAGLLIGSVSFSGSMIAYGKLEGKIKDFVFPAQHIVNLGVLAGIIAFGAWIMLTGTPTPWPVYVLFGLSLLYGVLFVLPIGGADMPVVISLLNSFTGVAAAFGGFLYNNPVMLTGGILVGSAGTILTILMCRAMNRSLTNVLIGAFSAKGSSSATEGDKTHREATPTDVAIMCAYAQQVVIVPGYGLAVAQAQHAVHEFEKILTDKGVNVKFAIHPVAGRMPGHMNVLLAEADVPYENLMEMEEINPQMPQTDVVLVIGANDVVNPAAEDDPGSPIYGMPIIQAAKAKQTIILKRSMGTGYAGIDNPLFYLPKTQMLLGDAKESLRQLIEELKGV